jgi:hypothetical protein
MIRTLQDALVERYAAGKRVVILIDEAHAMPAESLEEIRLLSNLESKATKLLQIALFAQPELDERLAANDMRQLRERITQHFNLSPLKPPKSAATSNSACAPPAITAPIHSPTGRRALIAGFPKAYPDASTSSPTRRCSPLTPAAATRSMRQRYGPPPRTPAFPRCNKKPPFNCRRCSGASPARLLSQSLPVCLQPVAETAI